MSFVKYALILSAALLSSAPAMAETTYIDSDVQGWISDTGGQFLPSRTHNMFTGHENGIRYNSYAFFEIPAGTYASATISMNPSAYGAAGLSQIDIFDVTSLTLSDLQMTIYPGKSAFDDLGTGTQYGSANLLDTYTTVSLNDAFTRDVNAAAATSHQLLIGFTNKTLNEQPADGPGAGTYVGGIGLQMAPLLLTLHSAVPEPATWAMMILGFGVVGAALRKNRQRSGAEQLSRYVTRT